MIESSAFATAVDAFEAVIAAEERDADIDPRCVSRLLHHARPVDRTIVLFHGFTNCPRQYGMLAAILFARGFNVWVPRLPRHGLRDKLTTRLAGLTAAELTTCASTAVHGAAGLGAAVWVLGLSVGGTLAAWLAQTYPLARAVAIAPFFSVAHVPSLLEPAMAGALLLAPNLELWWDPRKKANVGPAHGYPRFATHALGNCLQLGESVRDAARDAPPRTAYTTLVLNSKDPAIDNAAARDVWQRWAAHGARVDEYTFENLDVRHDIIEPETYADAETLVYPVLVRLLDA